MTAPDTIEARTQELAEFLASLDDWLSVYSYLIDSTLYLERITEDERPRAELIKDCQSETWLLVEGDASCVRIKAESEALIVKGLAGLLIRILDGQPAAAVAAANVNLLEVCPMLKSELNDVRRNGVHALAAHISLKASLLAKTPRVSVLPDEPPRTHSARRKRPHFARGFR